MRAMVSGVTDMLTAKTAEECGADFISFSFDRDDKNFVTPEKAVVIAQQIPDARIVGVFRDESLPHVNMVVRQVRLDYVQLNGHESEAYIQKVECPVIKRYSYDENFSAERARDSEAEIVLLDLGKNDYNGNEITKDIADTHKSVIVAANICKDNVRKVHKALHPYAVEVSEGIEVNGEKNIKMIRTFFRRIGSVMA